MVVDIPVKSIHIVNYFFLNCRLGDNHCVNFFNYVCYRLNTQDDLDKVI